MTSHYVLILGLYALASFGVILAIVEGAVSLFEPELCRTIERLRPSDGVIAHVLIRILPGLSAFVLTCFSALPGYLNGEPVQTHERPGLWLFSLALIGFYGISAPLVRVGWMGLSTRARTRSWRKSVFHEETFAHVQVFELRSSNPLVVASGLVHKAIFLSTTVRSLLSPRELRAVLRHEVAHCRNNHNLAKLLCAIAPRLLSTNFMDRSMHETIEYAADDEVSGMPGDALNLATAIVILAKRSADLSRGALYTALTDSAESAILERRIRRLVLPTRSATHGMFLRMACSCLSLVAGMAFMGTFPVVQNAFRESLEFLVH